MTLVRTAMALAITLLLAGCGTLTTKYPIGTTVGLGKDDALVGTWKGHFAEQDDKAPFYLHFLKVKDGPMVAIWVAPHLDDRGNGGAMLFDISTAKLGDNNFLNAREMNLQNKGTDDGRGTIALFYRLDGAGGLTLYGLDKGKVEKAMAAGHLKGSTTHHSGPETLLPYDDLQVTSEPAELDGFMQTPEAAALFTPSMILKKDQ